MTLKNFFLFLILATAAACADKPKVEAIKMATGSVESTVTTINSGTVEARNQAELAFGTVGRIAKIYMSTGTIVGEGTVIAELENADLRAVYDEAQKELSRANELFKNGLVSSANLDSARRAKEVARLNFEKTLMKAPFGGMITAMDLKIGEYYQSANLTATNKPLVQIIDLKKRIIKGDIDEVDLQKVAVGYPARVKIPALRNQLFKAKVVKVVPFVSTAKDQDRTSQIELEITDSRDDTGKEVLIPVGASADVEIVSETKENVKILPAGVLIGTGKTRSVFKVVDGKLKRAEVKIGIGNYERAEILEGLSADEMVAKPLNGIELIDGMKVEAEVKPWP